MSNEASIGIQNEKAYPISESDLIAAAEAVLKQHDAITSEMSIVVTDNEEVHALNKQYRQTDAPTDVLSFPAEPLPNNLGDDAPYIGDLVIAYPYASDQAQRLGHPMRDTLMLLVAHGTLHLLGYDHDTAENRKAMWAKQADALTALGIELAIVPSIEDDPHD